MSLFLRDIAKFGESMLSEIGVLRRILPSIG